MPQYITTNDSNGKAVFSDKVPSESIALPIGIGSLETLSTTHSFPVDINTEADIDQYKIDREHGLGGRICPPHGLAIGILNAEPNKASPFHRTMTHDFIYCLQGAFELHLDSGEKRTLNVGDSVIQRGVMHKWVNVTPNDGWGKMLAIGQPIVEPLEIGGNKLKMEFVPE